MGISGPQYHTSLGANCQQRQDGQVPVCIVTDVATKTIYFNNRLERDKIAWLIEGVNVYLQRFWSTSTARITLIPTLQSPVDPIPELPITDIETKTPLLPEDEICIFMGYLPVIREATLEDITKGYLTRVYIGSIDTIAATSTPSGTKLTIECRDRMKYLMDTFVTFDPNYDSSKGDSWFKSVSGKGKNAVTRSDLILTSARLGIGDIRTPDVSDQVETTTNGRFIQPGFIQDLHKLVDGKKDAQLKGKLAPPNYFYNCKVGTAFNQIPLRPKLFASPLALEDTMVFHIYTMRLGYKVEAIEKEFTVQNQVPIELIKYLAMQEPFPTEVFCNHLDGHFYYVPRCNDYSGLFDKGRFYRTYYCRNIPEEVGLKIPDAPFEAKSFLKEDIYKDLECEVPTKFDFQEIFKLVDKNQMLINFKEEFSSLALKTNYFVSNTAPGGVAAGAATSMHLSIRPAFLRGKKICGRNHFIYDETIQGLADAASVALQQARTQSKELKSASMTVIGDPTLCPGEVIQVVGSPLNPDSFNLEEIIKDRLTYLEYESASLNTYFSSAEGALKTVPKDNKGISYPDSVSTDASTTKTERATDGKINFKTAKNSEETLTFLKSVNDVEKSSRVDGAKDAKQGGFTQAPRTVFRVEGVRHSFTSSQSGWTTELALITPFI